MYDVGSGADIGPKEDISGGRLTHAARVNSLAFSTDAGPLRLATAGGDRTAKVWEIGPGRFDRPAVTLKGHTKDVTRVAFDRSGQFLATVGADKTVRVWGVGPDDLRADDTKTLGTERYTISQADVNPGNVAFGPGRRLAVTTSSSAGIGVLNRVMTYSFDRDELIALTSQRCRPERTEELKQYLRGLEPLSFTPP